MCMYTYLSTGPRACCTAMYTCMLEADGETWAVRSRPEPTSERIRARVKPEPS